ncbi:hypothetical protein IWZ03DRAFT_389019 [Phyllosticta citriasiana]|uniref:t-SNARE coiled-coil homology domain-containing protein n=1 Tax=Phyllosticta citriasiana TaxID=595635 RepID=A0ABR1KBM7_9PEZI
MGQEIKELKAERDQLNFDNDSLRKRIEESKYTTVRFSKDQEQHENDQEEIMRLRRVQSELLSRLNICETNLDLIVPEIYDLVDKVDVTHNATTRIKSGVDVMTSTLRRPSREFITANTLVAAGFLELGTLGMSVRDCTMIAAFLCFGFLLLGSLAGSGQR